MKLYYAKGACSLAVRITINELGLKSEYESVDLKTKQTETGQDFLKINSKGAVPTLLTDQGEILTENAVIQQYLADEAQATQLLPKTGDFKRYRVLEWQNYVSTELHKGVGILFNPNLPQEMREKITIPAIKSKMAYLNQHLGSHTYLLGDQFTLPDAYLFVILNWVIYHQFNLSDWPNVHRYFAALQQRPSIQKSMKEEKLQTELAK